jgi:hypothetical protein
LFLKGKPGRARGSQNDLNSELRVGVHNRYFHASTQKKANSVVDLSIVSPSKGRLVTASIIAVVLVLSLSFRFQANAEYLSEYQRYVQTYLNNDPLGNWTFMQKPVFPVFFNESQIPVGQNWTVVTPLMANHSYHVYCYGEWVNYGSEPKTDYNIYVYNPLGEMEGYHTESAGLPEHLGTTVNDPFFVPKQTGNYTFVIANAAGESTGAQQATFMIIEDVECNVWHQHYVEGRDGSGVPFFNTGWAYEFVTESQLVEVYIKVPKTLDMYEARLYLMSSSPNSGNTTTLNGVPVAWEPGLYGNRSQDNAVGGYNLESTEYRGNAYASCEYYGEDMFMNFTCPYPGKNLYHLVFIGEVGSGTIDYLVKTVFNNTALESSIVPNRAFPYSNTTIAYSSNSSELESAVLQYYTNDSTNMKAIDMEILGNRTCQAVIPGQAAGTTVNYVVRANDKLEDVLTANGSYPVKYASTLNFSATNMDIRLGENITLRGDLQPQAQGLPVEIFFSSTNETENVTCFTLDDGSFAVSFKPATVGMWTVRAEFDGSNSMYESESLMTVQVEESLLKQYFYYIIGGLGAVAGVGAVIYLRKLRA